VGIRGSQETCCGSMAFQLGFQGEFTKFAESNIDDWNAAGVPKWSLRVPADSAL